MRIDAHQHYWKLQRGDYGWLTPDVGSVLYQDYMPEQLNSELQKCGVTGTVIVQAAPTIEETEFLLDLCEQEETMLGVVGWLDVNGADFEQQYLRFRQNPRFVGIGPNFPAVPDGDWSWYPQLLRNLALLAEDGFPVDLLIRPADFPAMVKLLESMPKLKVVINHLAVPDIKNKRMEPWAKGLEAMAQFEPVTCKLSGLATGSGVGKQALEVAPYVKHAVDVFGTERLMFGSDWPVCLQAGSFTDMLEMVSAALPSELNGDQIEAVFGGNTVRTYRLIMKEMRE